MPEPGGGNGRRGPQGEPGGRTLPTGDPLPGEVTLEAVSCPNCAGVVSARPGSRIVSCRHCGTDFLQPLGDGYALRYFPVRVERLRAVGRATAWLRRTADLPNDIASSSFYEAHLVYVPVWEARAWVVGYEFGKKTRTRREVRRVGDQEVVDLVLEEEGVEAGFLDERRMYREAVDLTALGMRRPHITGRDFTLPLVPGSLEAGAAVLERETGLPEVWEQARRSFLRPPSGIQGAEQRLFLMRESASLIYYPLWNLRYRYRERSYEVVVDGRNGEVHAARGPADNRRRLAVMVGSVGVLAGASAVLLTAWREWELPPTIALYTALLIVALLGAVYWRFELIREVEHHESLSS